MTDIPDEEELITPTPLEQLNQLLRDERRRWVSRFIGLGVVVLIAVGFTARSNQIADKAQKAAERAQEATELVIAQRTEARINTCIKDKRFAEGHNAFVNSTTDRDNQFLLVLATSGGRQEVRPQDQALVDAQLAENNRVRDKNLVTIPDCTPQGIEDFYEGRTKGASP